MVDKKTGLKPKASSAKTKVKAGKSTVKNTETNTLAEDKELEIRGKKLAAGNKKQVASKKEVVETSVIKDVASSKDIAEEEPVTSSELPVTTEQEAIELKKAGKHSAKALREAEELAAKEERKKSEAVEDKPKITKKPTRPKHERASKKYREVYKLIDKTRTYPLAEALDLAIKTSTTKFDSSVEMHINLTVDPTQADHNIRGTVALPAGTGKKIRVAVFAEADDGAKAKTAGADIVGSDELLATLDKGQIDFDVLITLPSLMPKLGKYARLLGPKGLMPNPKSGSITTDVAKAVKDAKAGQVEYRVDSAGIVHLAFGKVSFGPEKLSENAMVILDAIKAARPSGIKGLYVKSIYVSSTMGPSIQTEMPA